MIKKVSDFDDFFVATLLADLFDPSGSNDVDFIAKKIINGLEEYEIIDYKGIEGEDIEGEELIAS
tara:strand:- start:132 stop:326 length:195 start_codon:yes stop_codon:yes gene_type:complete